MNNSVKDPKITVKFLQKCTVKMYRIALEQQHRLIDRQLTHPDLPSLWVTYGCANVNFNNPEQITIIRPEEIHGEVVAVDFKNGVLTCDVFFQTSLEVAQVIQNNDVYLSGLYTMIDDRVINLIRMYANIKIQYQGVE